MMSHSLLCDKTSVDQILLDQFTVKVTEEPVNVQPFKGIILYNNTILHSGHYHKFGKIP